MPGVQPSSGPGPAGAPAPADEPLIGLEPVATALGVLAFVAGITKRWVLDPLGEAFGDLEPTAKAVVALAVLVLTVLAISLVRWRHRQRVAAARRVVEADAAERAGTAETHAAGR